MTPPRDWLIVGQQMRDGPGVVLFASRTVGPVRIHEERSTRRGTFGEVVAQFGDDVIRVKADTFPEALVLLFQWWSPDPAQLRELWRSIQTELGEH